MMFVNCSPVRFNASESVCSLKFAKRCRSVQLGQATASSSNPEVLALQKRVAELTARLHSQGEKLKRAKASKK